MRSRREFLKVLSTLPLIEIAKIEEARGGTRYLLDECFVAGFRFHHGPALLSRMDVGAALEITAEPDNPYDPFAVRLDYLGAQIGYLPKSQNQVISRLLQQGVPVECHIARIDRDAPPWQAVTVQVSLLIEGEWLKRTERKVVTSSVEDDHISVPPVPSPWNRRREMAEAVVEMVRRDPRLARWGISEVRPVLSRWFVDYEFQVGEKTVWLLSGYKALLHTPLDKLAKEILGKLPQALEEEGIRIPG